MSRYECMSPPHFEYKAAILFSLPLMIHMGPLIYSQRRLRFYVFCHTQRSIAVERKKEIPYMRGL
jgi:hypothetical protein